MHMIFNLSLITHLHNAGYANFSKKYFKDDNTVYNGVGKVYVTFYNLFIYTQRRLFIRCIVIPGLNESCTTTWPISIIPMKRHFYNLQMLSETHVPRSESENCIKSVYLCS